MAAFDGYLMLALALGALALGIWAFVDSLIRPAAAYVAMGKLTKPAWAAITGVSALVLYLQGPLNLLGLPAVIAVIVYLVDVRPAVGGLRRNNDW
ncbi:DUF2516 family protein [Blastococcus sp. CCUG 61487]|uniref:DUF2516 family protein n=1 Tax=Blastococcus sp. CCUG 61487 TaxID=1840703 RepID=UPI0010C0FC98|nr:DUF2516 family protein [Blastococcus sp. CCUG 61487]TKJ29747.1 hypothetical protein A6V29_02175 [Blastococcus sp. CCUG 61487]